MPDLKIRHALKQDIDVAKLEGKNPNHNFIPFVCHFDPNTILTKNGELMQVVKVTGFNHESIDSDLVNLRETLRDSMERNIKTDNFAVWLHTIRRKKDISLDGGFQDYFSKNLDEDWNKANDWQNQFVNEFYLTLIIQGYNTSIINGISLIRSLSGEATRKLHIKELNKAHDILSTTISKIIADLNNYGAELIGIREFDGILCSEPMGFFGKIINLAENNFPLKINDITNNLIDQKIAFGNQVLEVSRDNKKHFATMLSVKEYREVSIASLDKFLQIPQEFIITQSLDFIDRNKALKHFEYQNYILEVSGDSEFRYLSDLEQIIESDTKGETNYASQQINVMLLNNKLADLNQDISSALEKLHKLGIVTVREDIFTEHCFWSQLPGNFQFLRRQKPIMISRVAGFASLHNFPAGTRKNNHWGSAVSVFRTVLGTPYFFNFHNKNSGHTLIAGPFGSGKTILLNFLVSQSRKFQNKLYYFGYQRSGNIFINSIGGNYLSISKEKQNSKTLKLNPLFLSDNQNNRTFLYTWFSSLVSYGKDSISREEFDRIPKIVDQIIASKTTAIGQAAEFFNTKETQNIYNKLSIWHSEGKCAFIFDHKQENDLNTNLVNAFNLTMIAPYNYIVVPIISYILHKIEGLISGDKTLIVLDEAWRLLDNYITGPKINDWLVRLKNNNCVVIFATESINDISKSKITEAINHNIDTQIFLPNPNPSQYYQTVFGLNEIEFALLSAMSKQERQFLLKKDYSIVASLNLEKLGNYMKVLSSKPRTLVIMEEMMKNYGSNPEEWLPHFYEASQEPDDNSATKI